MNQWTFVIAAYAVTLVATAALLAWALATMRRAEAEVEKLGSRE